MKYFKSTIQYDGTGYYGWQKQPNQRTIQGEIESVLKKITKSENIQVIGSGRTDAGVHAFGQVIRIGIDSDLDKEAIFNALNSLLPDNIILINIEDSSEEFQPVFDAIKKEYRYYFTVNSKSSPFLLENIQPLHGDYDLDKMREACQLFLGKHDFMNFCTTGTPVKTTEREIFECSIEKAEFPEGHMTPQDIFYFKVVGEGFLKQMVRLVVSSVWAYSKGKINREDVLNSFEHKLENKLAPTAPARGLYLYKVDYK